MYRGVHRRRSIGHVDWLPANRGFTIVETLIVLAVTGALFVAIAASLAGRQNAAEFTHAIQSMQSQLQQVINDVADGFYPSQSNFTCTNGGGRVQFSAGANGQGTNQACILLGKVVQFDVHGTNPEEYRVYTIAGLRCGPGTGVSCPAAGATSPFGTVRPAVLGVSGNYTDYSTSKTLEYGLTTAWMKVNGSNIGAVAFLTEPGTQDSGSTTGFTSGGQQVDLIPIRTTRLNQSVGLAVTNIEYDGSGAGGLQDPQLAASAPIDPSGGVQICFVSGGTRQSGLITIGSNGRQLLVSLQIKGNRTCS